MPRSESQITKDNVDSHSSAIQGIRGTFFFLAIINDEDDAATLRADLKRSRLSEYKLQRCSSLEEACKMLRACGFDLLFLNWEELNDPDRSIERLREAGYENPILGLHSRRTLEKPDFRRPPWIEEFICKEDLSPSLIEHAIRSVIARHALSAERTLVESRLNLALELGRMGVWTYHPKTRQFELDGIAQAMLEPEGQPPLYDFENLIERIYPEDRATFSDTLSQLPLKNEIVVCQFRLNLDQVPLPSYQIRGRIWRAGPHEEPSITGVLRQTPRTNELYERIAEANTAMQEAFQAREEAMRNANLKLKAIADEIERAEGRNATLEPASNPSTSQSSPSSPELTSEKPLPSNKPPVESLEIDKETTYQEVLKTVARQKTAKIKQESLPFDFAQEPVSDYSPPNPAKEGFAGAAKRLVALTRKEHHLDASISIADQQSIELELKKDLLFEILRELITNVIQHSRATLCIITLFRDEDEWVLQVEDDGVGLDDKLKSVNAPLNKIGLFQIRTQLALKGGHLDMVPASPKGLIARVRIPVTLRDGAKSR